jgi:hypothetical protein
MILSPGRIEARTLPVAFAATTPAVPVALFEYARLVVSGAAWLGLDKAGELVMGSAWPYFKLALKPLLDEFPGLQKMGTPLAKEAADAANRALRENSALRLQLEQSFTSLRRGQEEILAVLNDHEARLQRLEEVVLGLGVEASPRPDGAPGQGTHSVSKDVSINELAHLLNERLAHVREPIGSDRFDDFLDYMLGQTDPKIKKQRRDSMNPSGCGEGAPYYHLRMHHPEFSSRMETEKFAKKLLGGTFNYLGYTVSFEGSWEYQVSVSGFRDLENAFIFADIVRADHGGRDSRFVFSIDCGR